MDAEHHRPSLIVQALGDTKPTPGRLRVDELAHPNRKFALQRRDRIANLFITADKLLKRWERQNVRKIRGSAIREAETWMVQHLQHSEGLGAIYPSMMYAIMAMDALGDRGTTGSVGGAQKLRRPDAGKRDSLISSPPSLRFGIPP